MSLFYFRPMIVDEPYRTQACGITIQGNDKWKTLIQNASKSDQ